MNQSEQTLVDGFLVENDFSPNTREAFKADLKKWVAWFETANGEQYDSRRVTSRDVADFRRSMRDVRRQSVATVNRSLACVRRYFRFLVGAGVIPSNPAVGIKELRRVAQPPKAVDRAVVRRLFREATVRNDIRGLAILSLMLHTGLRVGEVAALELDDLDFSERQGTVRVRDGKGSKERVVAVPAEAREAIQHYLNCRPSVDCDRVFLGCGGLPLGTDGLRHLVKTYGLAAGVGDLHPHALRHTFATFFLSANGNDLVGLSQVLGHESIQTTARYTQRTAAALNDASERVVF